MKLSIPTGDLRDAVKAAEAAMPTGPTPNEVLKGLYLHATPDDGLTVVGSNLDAIVRARVPMVVVDVGGSVVLPKKFVELVNTLPSGSDKLVEIEVGPSETVVRVGRSGYKFAHTAYEFPLPGIDTEEPVVVSGADLAACMRVTFAAATPNSSRANMRAVLLSPLEDGAGLRAVALDGARLAVSTVAGANTRTPAVPDTAVGGVRLPEVVLPIGQANLLSSVLNPALPASVTVSHSYLRVVQGDITMQLRMASEPFVNWHIIRAPDEWATVKASVPRAALQSALARAKLFIGAPAFRVKLEMADGAITLSGGEDHGLRELVDVECDGAVRMAFNVNLFAEQVKAMQADTLDIVFRGPAPVAGAVIEGKLMQFNEEAFYAALIPVRWE